ncbi:cytidylate kinase [Neokomagataea thailandica NBRC 106555]|uniref:Cytidylate kinase n=2 Tax=Neokomagataea TaxID=1223423 RepID=A0A4Y6V6I1_9PROT|nr:MULTISPECIES: (d)CMP kinase [Neokomagataea]QDH24240.1 (d)CMP kinase [Neokomagataea tanensis]GBR52901.1 cytidylate kinase [Neokomagataea thailandica NBRC 106555]
MTAGFVIAVDGPAAAGKGTLARALADAYSLPYLDTGLLYRAVARRVLDAGLRPEDAAEEAALRLVPEDMQRNDLRVPEVDRAASIVAAQPAVRAALLERQRVFGREGGAVVDGRDIGTVVFPDAPVKLFITASSQIRAMRRHNQLNVGVELEGAALEAAIAEIESRDTRDSQRDVAPLCPADDALTINTDGMSAAEVFQKACDYIALRRS